MEISYCEPKQGPLLGEDDETEIVDYFMNSLISSKLPEDDVIETTKEDSYVFKSNGLCVTAGIGEHLNGVFGEEMKHRMDALKNKTKIRALTEEDVHYCEQDHGTIFGEDDVEERLAESLMNYWASSDQQKDVLIRESVANLFVP